MFIMIMRIMVSDRYCTCMQYLFCFIYIKIKHILFIDSLQAQLISQLKIVTCHIFIQNTIDELVKLEHKDSST